MIRPILCEGIYDSWFLEEFIRKEYSKDAKCIDKDLGVFQRCYRSDYYFCQDSIIILSDHGHELINKYIPKIFRDLFAKRILSLHYCVLKDLDDSQPVDLLESYCRIFNDAIKTKGMRDIFLSTNFSDNIISLISEKDHRISFHFHFIFVPQSLAKIIVRKSLEMNRSLNKHNEDIESMDPHRALTKIACSCDIDTKEALIRRSVVDMWFSDDDWYKKLKEKIDFQLNGVT